MFNKYQKVYRNLAVIEIRRAHYSFSFLTVLLSFGLLRGNHDCSRHNVGHICWSPCIKCASVKLMLLITLQLCCSRWFQPLTDQWRGTDSALSALPTRLSSLKKKSTCGPWIRSTEKPSPKYCLLLCVQKCQWWTRTKPVMQPGIVLTPRPHVSGYLWKQIFFQSFARPWSHAFRNISKIYIYMYIFPTDKSALFLSVVRIFSLRFPKSMYPYLTYSNCFRPFWRNAKTSDSPGMTYDIIVRPHARNDNRAFSKTCDFGARKRRLHGDGWLKRRKKFLKKKVWA